MAYREHISSAVGLQDEVCHKGKVNDPENYGLYIDVDNLATHTEKQSNHFISSTSKGGYLDRSELRDWLRRLWKLRPDLHQRLWKVCPSNFYFSRTKGHFGTGA